MTDEQQMVAACPSNRPCAMSRSVQTPIPTPSYSAPLPDSKDLTSTQTHVNIRQTVTGPAA